MAREDAGAAVTVTGDHDFRVAKFCAFYAPYTVGGERLNYRGRAELPAGGANWLLIHRLDDRHPPTPIERDAQGNEYRQVRAYPSVGPACWGWYVYRNVRTGESWAQQQTREGPRY